MILAPLESVVSADEYAVVRDETRGDQRTIDAVDGLAACVDTKDVTDIEVQELRALIVDDLDVEHSAVLVGNGKSASIIRLENLIHAQVVARDLDLPASPETGEAVA